MTLVEVNKVIIADEAIAEKLTTYFETIIGKLRFAKAKLIR